MRSHSLLKYQKAIAPSQNHKGDRTNPSTQMRSHFPNITKAIALPQPSSAICAACSTEGIAPAPEWKKFSPDEGKFSILMPSEEISDITPDKSEKPDGVESTKMYLSTNETNVFMVSYADFNNDVTQIPSSELLDFAVQGILEDGKKLLSQENITLGAYPGIEMKLWDEKEGIFMTGRVFIVNQRLYILFVGSDKNPQVSDVRKFFDSFELMQ